MNAAYLITKQLRRQERRRLFIAGCQYLLELLSYAAALFVFWVLLVLVMSL